LRIWTVRSKVDVVDLAALDLGVGRGVERSPGLFGCHRISRNVP